MIRLQARAPFLVIVWEIPSLRAKVGMDINSESDILLYLHLDSLYITIRPLFLQISSWNRISV